MNDRKNEKTHLEPCCTALLTAADCPTDADLPAVLTLSSCDGVNFEARADATSKTYAILFKVTDQHSW